MVDLDFIQKQVEIGFLEDSTPEEINDYFRQLKALSDEKQEIIDFLLSNAKECGCGCCGALEESIMQKKYKVTKEESQLLIDAIIYLGFKPIFRTKLPKVPQVGGIIESGVSQYKVLSAEWRPSVDALTVRCEKL